MSKESPAYPLNKLFRVENCILNHNYISPTSTNNFGVPIFSLYFCLLLVIANSLTKPYQDESIVYFHWGRVSWEGFSKLPFGIGKKSTEKQPVHSVDILPDLFAYREPPLTAGPGTVHRKYQDDTFHRSGLNALYRKCRKWPDPGGGVYRGWQWWCR